MPKMTRTYSAYTLDAIRLLGKLIKHERVSREMTSQDLADRAGISRDMLWRIEKGDPKCTLGMVFEVATLVGVRLFDSDENALATSTGLVDSKLAVLPKAVQKSRREVDDDF